MLKAKSLLLSLAFSSVLGLSSSARAEHCYWRFGEAFRLLDTRDLRTINRGATTPSELQAKAEIEVDLDFGPPVAECEEGGYTVFLDRFERWTTRALRMKAGEDRDTRLRIAIAIIRRGPETVDYTDQSKERARFDQMQSGIGAVAQEVGMTPLSQQLLDAIKAEGAPKATRRPDSAPPEMHTSKVYVPTVPLPGWAVVSIYEIEDHARRKENEKIEGKVQAIINWMKSVTPQTPPR